MKVKPILNPLQGEHVLAVDPPLKPSFEADWRRRLNLYTGRSLSDTALTIEQDERTGRLATRGQMVSPGVVSGLEIEVVVDFGEPDPNVRKAPVFYYKINSGFGIAASGEDVIVQRRLQINVNDTRVYAPTTMLNPPAPEEPELKPEESIPELRDELLRLDTREARILGPRLKDLSAEARALLPRVGILVLQPVVAEVVAEMDDTDPCEQDPQSYAYDDWQMVDGARLILYAWPADAIQLPLLKPKRNILAYTIFEAEASLAADQLLPWEEVGVPIGLVSFDDVFRPEFVDRYSVVRAGGKPRRRASHLDVSGSPFIWQARLQQFAEQVTTPEMTGLPIDQIAEQFRFLPPAGLLPRDAVEFVFSQDPNANPSARSRFFSNIHRLEAAPIPIEQLDVMIEASAALAPLDTFTGEQIQLFVPVPAIYYHPELLIKERVDERFQIAINRFTTRQTELLFRRRDVRSKEKLIRKSITGKEPVYTEADPAGTMTLDPIEEAYGTNLAASPPFVVAVNDLKNTLRAMGPFMLREVDANLDLLGLERFIEFLENKVDRANDLVDFAFLNTQTNIYRVRQHILGDTAGTRLATSPSLAAIAKGESALATRDTLKAFTETVKSGPTIKATTPVGAKPTAQEIGIEKISGISGAASLSTGLKAAQSAIISKTADLKTSAIPAATTSQLLTSATSGVTELFRKTARTKADVIEQSAIIGEFIDFRTVTVVARLEEPASAESRRFAVAAKHQVISDLINLGINLDGVEIPGVVNTQAPGEKKPNITFDILKAPGERDRILREILNGVHDPVPADADEAAFFSVAVRALDTTIGILRMVEGRIQAYRIAIEACRGALDDARELADEVAKRLQAIEDELAETRHDLSVASALLVEETDRVKAINERRKLIIEQQVSFLAYRRPRTVDLLADVPVRALDPGLMEAPVPACLGHDVAVPPDLRATVELLRQVPIRWLVYVQPLLEKLDRVDIIRETVITSVARAQIQVQPKTSSPGLFAKAIDNVLTAQHAVVSKQRVQIANLDLGEVFNQNWKAIRDRASDAVSLTGLIEAGHGRSDVAAQATRELNDITHIAACLYQMFCDVLPAIRLGWAESISQYDAPVNLRNLSSLPGWGEKGSDGEDVIAFLHRRQMQILTDWLYGRVDPRQAEAVALINDLVRICILLASHAPVNQIISGHVPKPTVVIKGGRVELAAVDFNKVRIGMHVLMYSDNNIVARGVVDDLSSSHVSAQVVHTTTASVQLADKARVEFGDPDSFDRAIGKVFKS